MSVKEMQEEFKKILLYGYQRGNESQALSAQDLVKELSEKMRDVVSKIEVKKEHRQ